MNTKLHRTTTSIKTCLYVLVAFLLSIGQAPAIDFFAIPPGGIGITINNNTPYPITVQAPIGPGTAVSTIKLRPHQIWEQILPYWGGFADNMYVIATYRGSTSRRYVSISRFQGRSSCGVRVNRTSPGIIRIQ